MAAHVKQGYAVVGTDTGHTGHTPDFGRNNPEAIIDWGYRTVHTSIVNAKRVVAEFYGRNASFSYFQGCSTGGHQALMEAQRFPDDFNGITAGAPGRNGWSAMKPPHRSSPCETPAESLAKASRAHCVPTRRSRDTTAPACPTRRQASVA